MHFLWLEVWTVGFSFVKHYHACWPFVIVATVGNGIPRPESRTCSNLSRRCRRKTWTRSRTKKRSRKRHRISQISMFSFTMCRHQRPKSFTRCMMHFLRLELWTAGFSFEKHYHACWCWPVGIAATVGVGLGTEGRGRKAELAAWAAADGKRAGEAGRKEQWRRGTVNRSNKKCVFVHVVASTIFTGCMMHTAGYCDHGRCMKMLTPLQVDLNWWVFPVAVAVTGYWLPLVH